MKYSKTIENNILLPKYKNNMQFNGFKTYENTFNLNTDFNNKKKKMRKIKFQNNINNQELNKNNDDNEEPEFKKAVVGGKLINKKIKIV